MFYCSSGWCSWCVWARIVRRIFDNVLGRNTKTSYGAASERFGTVGVEMFGKFSQNVGQENGRGIMIIYFLRKLLPKLCVLSGLQACFGCTIIAVRVFLEKCKNAVWCREKCSGSYILCIVASLYIEDWLWLNNNNVQHLTWEEKFGESKCVSL